MGTYYDQLLEIDLADSYSDFGKAFFQMGDYKSAIKYYKLALEIRKRLFPEDQEDEADSYDNLSVSYERMRE